MSQIRLLLVEDHAPFRKALRNLLLAFQDIEWMGECEDGEQAVQLLSQSQYIQPQVILMDIQMPRLNGIDTTRQILEIAPHIGILMLTTFEDDDLVFAAMRAGARGYLLKGTGPDAMLRAIQAVANGEAIFSPILARRMIKFFADKPGVNMSIGGTRSDSHIAISDLTEREREVLTLLSRGLNTGAIALNLTISEKTVRNHVSNIFIKLQVSDRVQAVLWARQMGL